MKSESKTLVILDTNKIRNNFEWERDYSLFEPKGDFIKIINWVEDNQLQDSVFIGLPEIVIDELTENRYQNFNQQLDTVKSNVVKLGNMDCFDFSNIILPDESFDYRKFIKNKINDYVTTKKFIIILKLEKDLFANTLESLIKKSVTKEKPFTENGKGFKDAVIWEILLNYKNIEIYSNVFIFSENEKDFDLKDEFMKKISKDLNLEVNIDALIVTLEETYHLHVKYPKLVSYLKKDYFKSKFIDYITGISDMVIINFKINNITEIHDVTKIDLDDFDISTEYSGKDFSNLKRIDLSFSNDNLEFNSGLIFDYDTDEIISLTYEVI